MYNFNSFNEITRELYFGNPPSRYLSKGLINFDFKKVRAAFNYKHSKSSKTKSIMYTCVFMYSVLNLYEGKGVCLSQVAA